MIPEGYNVFPDLGYVGTKTIPIVAGKNEIGEEVLLFRNFFVSN